MPKKDAKITGNKTTEKKVKTQQENYQKSNLVTYSYLLKHINMP